MELRKLELKDAPLMLEWMHDSSVVRELHGNFMEKTILDCNEFIKKSWEDFRNLHRAITDERDIYMGTVSLKNIEKKNACAEFAIAMRSVAMGKGFSKYAIEEVLRMGFDKMKLKKIYWYVSKENKRAIRFYDKNGYRQVDKNNLKFLKEGGMLKNTDSFLWYLETADWVTEETIVKKN